jgi:hypothetical protein
VRWGVGTVAGRGLQRPWCGTETVGRKSRQYGDAGSETDELRCGSNARQRVWRSDYALVRSRYRGRFGGQRTDAPGSVVHSGFTRRDADLGLTAWAGICGRSNRSSDRRGSAHHRVRIRDSPSLGGWFGNCLDRSRSLGAQHHGSQRGTSRHLAVSDHVRAPMTVLR